MAVTEGQFIVAFDRLEASFARSLSKKNRDGWYDEVKECDFQCFKAAINQLSRGDSFPNFQKFWALYNIEAKRSGQKRSQYCGHCIDGWVLFYAPVETNGKQEDRTFAAFCEWCKPGRKPSRVPSDPNIRWAKSPKSHNEPARQRVNTANIGKGIGGGRKMGDQEKAARESQRQRNIEAVEKAYPYSDGETPF